MSEKNTVLQLEKNYELIKESKAKWLDKRVRYMLARAFVGKSSNFDEVVYLQLNEALKKEAGVFSNLSQPVRGSIVGLMMVNEKTSADDAKNLVANYKEMKKAGYRSSPFTYFGAYLLLFAEPEQRDSIMTKGHELYREIKEHHRFLTGPEDGAMALSIVLQEKTKQASASELGELIEKYYKALREVGFKRNDELQFAAATAAMISGTFLSELISAIKVIIQSLKDIEVKFQPPYYNSIILLAYTSLKTNLNLAADLPRYLGELKDNTKLNFQKSFRQTLALSLYLNEVLDTMPSEDVNAMALNLNLMIIQEQMAAVTAAVVAASASASSTS